MIYMDNAATTMQKPQQVIDAVAAAMCSMGNAGRGAHAASLGAARTIYDAREKLACFSCGKSETDCIYDEFNGKSEYSAEGGPESGRSCDHNDAGTQFSTSPSV